MLSYQIHTPCYKSLYEQLRKDLLAGVFPQGTKLPSKRSIAADLNLSLTTVEKALDMLVEEGLIEAVPKKGFYACARSVSYTDQEEIVFLDPEPADIPEDFPIDLWAKTIRRVLSKDRDRLFAKSPAAGCSALRNALASYLRRSRSINVQPCQIIVGSGSESLYQLLTRLFGPFHAAIESPGYPPVETVYASAGCILDKIPMAADGLEKEVLFKSEAQFLHVSPFCSWPLNISAVPSRRQDYLDWIHERSGYLIEDDYRSEFYKAGPLPRTLFSMDTQDKVIYMNTFSKSLCPGLRLGYLILPMPLLSLYEEKAGVFSNTVPVLEQYALAEFINNGSFERLIARRRRAQKNR